MALDSFKNLAYSLVTTAPAPADSGTSLDVTDATLFPTVPFNATVWPASSIATAANAEIVRVTLIVANTLTVTRTQEGTAARTILVGDQIAATITALTLSTLEADRSAVSALATLADTHAGTASAAATSADAHANTASAAATSADAHAQAASVVAAAASALATVADTHANTVSAQLVSVSAVLTAAIQTASAAATSADAHANTASAAATSADGHANTVSAAANTISAQLVSVSAALTAAIQVASAAATSADGHANAVSIALTGKAPWISAIYTVVSNTQSVAVSAMTGLSGLSITFGAAQQWHFEGRVLISTSAVGAGVKFGASVAGGLAAAPRFMGVWSFVGAVTTQSALATGAFGLLAQSGLTTILSSTSVASAGALYPIEFYGMILASAAGSLQLAAAGIASTAASPLHVVAGSYLKAFRVT